MMPVVRALERHPQFQTRLCLTGQHREMLDQVISVFGMKVDFDLDVMKTGQSPTEVAATTMSRLAPLLQSEKPDWVLVQGDTTTVAAAALAAFYSGARVGHVEAGLRSFDKYQPFPEEINRQVTTAIAAVHFAPTETARLNLIRENIPEADVFVTGNTVIDALHIAADMPYAFTDSPFADVPWKEKRVILVTAHRRENFGQPMENICTALRDIALAFRDDVHVVYPVHLNPNVQEPVRRILANLENVTLTPPVEYLALVKALQHAYLVVTDSGGIQEEAPGFGKPVLVLREVTERPEGVAAGTAALVGTDREAIKRSITTLLTDPAAYDMMARAANPYGDGCAAGRIVDALLQKGPQSS